MTYSVGDFLTAAQRERTQLVEHLGTARRLAADHASKLASVVADRDRVLGEFTSALLPDLTADACARASQLTGHIGIVRDNPRAQLEAQRAVLPGEIATIEADPRYRDRELLRAPRVGTLTRQVDELTFFGQPLKDLVDTCESHLDFRRLLELGYGTDQYKVGFWRASYYSNRRAASDVVGKVPGKKSFAEVRTEYLQAKETLTVYETKLATLHQEIADGEALEVAHDERVRMLRDIETIHLTHWRSILANHLAVVDVESLGRRLQGQEELEVLAKTWLGLRAKTEQLEKMAQESLMPAEARLTQDIARLDRDITKYSRPKNLGVTFDSATFDRRFGRAGRWDRTWQRYQTNYGIIYDFNDYNLGSFSNDLVWADLMSHAAHHHDYDDHAVDAAVAAVIVDQNDATTSDLAVDPS